MEKRRKFQWETYIRGLPDFPLLTQKWEQDFVRAICKSIPRQEIGNVLEVGCSNGRWLRWFSGEYGCEVWGVDNEASVRDWGGSVVKLTNGDALNLPFKDEAFDVVISMGLVEHFSEKDKYKILEEQQRVLKDGGHLICQAPLLSYFSLNHLYVKWFYDYRKGTKHFKTTKRELENYYQKMGLKTIFSGLTGCLFESNPLKKLSRFDTFGFLFATEILIIGRKNAE
jgi:ubiquinone/menaquinone biosynthesis C-methylase UbiE